MYEQQFNPFAANVAIVKGYFKSGKILAMGILYILSAVLSVLTALTVSSSPSNNIANLLYEMGLDSSDVSALYSSAASSAAISAILTVLMSALYATAFIIIFAKSRSQKPDSSPIAGVSILHVLAVIAFVCSIILTVSVGILYLMVAIIGSAVSSDPEATVGVIIIAGILLAVLMFLLIFATASAKNYYRSVKYSLITIQLQSKGAAAFGVLEIIVAVFIGIAAIGTIVDTVTSHGTAEDILALVSLILSFITVILNASIALGYNKYINRQTLGYNNTPYGGTPANAYAPMPGAQPTYPNQPYQNQPSVPYNDNFANYNAPQQSVPYNDNFTDYNAPASQPKPSVCPYCGAPTEPAQSFCGNCGNKL